jgi:hypothetical protein
MERFGSVQMIKDPDTGGPKIYGSYGYGSGTLVTVLYGTVSTKRRLINVRVSKGGIFTGIL